MAHHCGPWPLKRKASLRRAPDRFRPVVTPGAWPSLRCCRKLAAASAGVAATTASR